MQIEPLAPQFWWIPYVVLAVAAACFAFGLLHVYRIIWFRRHRDTPISNPVIAKFLKGQKPPPYALYASGWFAAGAALVFSVVPLVIGT